jgi:hypothetical protein
MAKGSVREEQLADHVRNWVPDVKSAIIRAPAFDQTWRTIAADRFLETLRQSATQNALPGLGAS